MKKLYVDDIRNPPDDSWDLARSYDEAIEKLSKNKYELVSLDHDLGFEYMGIDRERTGYDITLWLANRKMNGEFVPNTVKVHSANPVGSERMRSVIKRYLT